jgi:hypothetical protein
MKLILVKVRESSPQPVNKKLLGELGQLERLEQSFFRRHVPQHLQVYSMR